MGNGQKQSYKYQMKKKKKKYKSVITQRIFESLQKVGVYFLVLALIFSMITMSGTNAGFSDEEKSENNSFSASSLDALIAPTDFSYTTGTAPMELGDIIAKKVNFKNDGKLSFQYGVQYLSVGGSVVGKDLCDALLLTAKKDSAVIYSKLPLKDFDLPLKDFDTGGVIPSVPLMVLNPTESDDWEFILELPANSAQTLENQTCNFNFKFTAWQVDFTDKSLGFWDEELADPNADGIEIETGEWVGPGDVVINEIMWMGSNDSSSDEWIELKNMTDKKINLKNWNIERAVSGSGGHLEIAHDKDVYIPANGFLLIANKNEDSSDLNVDVDVVETNISLNNNYKDNGALILEDKDGNTMDATPIPNGNNWPAGKKSSSPSEYRSMQRKLAPGDGTVKDNWFTVNHPAANDTDYWDKEINNYGTPGGENLLPIVLNEFVPNPSEEDTDLMPRGEWIELWNNDSEDWDVDGWIISNGNGKEIKIASSNSDNNNNVSDGGETIVPNGGSLVVYVNGHFTLEDFFENNSNGKIYLYAKYGDVKFENDYYEYSNPDIFQENKAYQRIPSGSGPWTDLTPTPGEKNKLNNEEEEYYRELVFEECFDGREFNQDEEYPLCKGIFLQYLGLLDNQYDNEISEEVYDKMLKKINKDEINNENKVEDIENNEGKISEEIEEEKNKEELILKADENEEEVINKNSVEEERLEEKHSPAIEEDTEKKEKVDVKKENEENKSTEKESEKDKKNEPEKKLVKEEESKEEESDDEEKKKDEKDDEDKNEKIAEAKKEEG